MERVFKLRLFLQYICRVELEHLPLALRKLTNTSLQYLSRPQAPTKAHLIKIPKSGLKSAYPDKGRVIPKIYFSGGRGASGAAILMFPLGVTTWNQKRNSSASNTAMASQTNKNKVMHDVVLDFPRKFIFTVRRNDESVNTSLCIVEAYAPFPIVAVVSLCGDSK